MSVPTGIGNYQPGVTDNDPHFDDDRERCPDCGEEECKCEPLPPRIESPADYLFYYGHHEYER